jgi:hypothetical protein
MPPMLPRAMALHDTGDDNTATVAPELTSQIPRTGPSAGGDLHVRFISQPRVFGRRTYYGKSCAVPPAFKSGNSFVRASQ